MVSDQIVHETSSACLAVIMSLAIVSHAIETATERCRVWQDYLNSYDTDS